MLPIRETIQKNKERLQAIRQPYDPITGLGSISTPRKTVRIEGFPFEELHLPQSFCDTPLVCQLTQEGGARRFAHEHLHSELSEPIRNELWLAFSAQRIKHDFEFFCYACVLIAGKGKGKDVPFLLNRAQRIYLKSMEELRLADRPIDIILCKSRQWGGSTLTQIYMLWIQLFHRMNWNSAICGHVQSSARTVTGMLQKAIDHIPLWATDYQHAKTSPFQGSQSTRIISYNNGRYSIGSAERPESIRSEDISMAHLTEVGLWRDTKGKKPEDLVQAIFGSILSGPYTMKVIESTAKGVGNYFHRTWLDAVAGTNNFRPVFIPWYIDDKNTEYIDPKQYIPFIHSLTEYEEWLFNLGATLEAIAWYRTKRLEIKDEWRMKSEYPSDAEEAFQSTGRNIFPRKYIENVRRTCIGPTYIGDFVADDIKGPKAFAHLRFEPRTPEGTDQNLWHIWQLPDYTTRYRDRYIVSVDIGGTGEKADYSVIKIADRLPMLELQGVPEVVAEWHGHIEHDLLIWKAAQAAQAYGTALLVVESNTLETEGTEGDNFEYVLDEIAGHYDNLYSRTSPEQIRQGMPVRYGFHTNPKSKNTIINHLRTAMRDSLYLERSLPTTFELQTYELKENGTEMGAVDGCHDDLVMATAILIYVCYRWPLPVKIESYTGQGKTKVVSEASI